MGGDDSKPKIEVIVPEGQVMVDMTTHNKATGSGATMDRLRRLGDDIIELSRQLNHKMELAALALFDKVKAGSSGPGGVTWQFVGDMSKLTTDFFMDTRVYNTQKSSKKMPKSKKTVTSDSDSSESENLCGKLHSQPTKEEIEKRQCWCTTKWVFDLPGIHSYQQ